MTRNGAIIIPYGWKRNIKASISSCGSTVTYVSPSGAILSSIVEVCQYLEKDDTCKCGLRCPIHPPKLFSFNPEVKSVNLTRKEWSRQENNIESRRKNCKHWNKLLKTQMGKKKASCHSELMIEPPPKLIIIRKDGQLRSVIPSSISASITAKRDVTSGVVSKENSTTSCLKSPLFESGTSFATDKGTTSIKSKNDFKLQWIKADDDPSHNDASESEELCFSPDAKKSPPKYHSQNLPGAFSSPSSVSFTKGQCGLGSSMHQPKQPEQGIVYSLQHCQDPSFAMASFSGAEFALDVDPSYYDNTPIRQETPKLVSMLPNPEHSFQMKSTFATGQILGKPTDFPRMQDSSTSGWRQNQVFTADIQRQPLMKYSASSDLNYSSMCPRGQIAAVRSPSRQTTPQRFSIHSPNMLNPTSPYGIQLGGTALPSLPLTSPGVADSLPFNDRSQSRCGSVGTPAQSPAGPWQSGRSVHISDTNPRPLSHSSNATTPDASPANISHWNLCNPNAGLQSSYVTSAIPGFDNSLISPFSSQRYHQSSSVMRYSQDGLRSKTDVFLCGNPQNVIASQQLRFHSNSQSYPQQNQRCENPEVLQYQPNVSSFNPLSNIMQATKQFFPHSAELTPFRPSQSYRPTKIQLAHINEANASGQPRLSFRPLRAMHQPANFPSQHFISDSQYPWLPSSTSVADPSSGKSFPPGAMPECMSDPNKQVLHAPPAAAKQKRTRKRKASKTCATTKSKQMPQQPHRNNFIPSDFSEFFQTVRSTNSEQAMPVPAMRTTQAYGSQVPMLPTLTSLSRMPSSNLVLQADAHMQPSIVTSAAPILSFTGKNSSALRSPKAVIASSTTIKCKPSVSVSVQIEPGSGVITPPLPVLSPNFLFDDAPPVDDDDFSDFASPTPAVFDFPSSTFPQKNLPLTKNPIPDSTHSTVQRQAPGVTASESFSKNFSSVGLAIAASAVSTAVKQSVTIASSAEKDLTHPINVKGNCLPAPSVKPKFLSGLYTVSLNHPHHCGVRSDVTSLISSTGRVFHVQTKHKEQFNRRFSEQSEHTGTKQRRKRYKSDPQPTTTYPQRDGVLRSQSSMDLLVAEMCEITEKKKQSISIRSSPSCTVAGVHYIERASRTVSSLIDHAAKIGFLTPLCSALERHSTTSVTFAQLRPISVVSTAVNSPLPCVKRFFTSASTESDESFLRLNFGQFNTICQQVSTTSTIVSESINDRDLVNTELSSKRKEFKNTPDAILKSQEDTSTTDVTDISEDKIRCHWQSMKKVTKDVDAQKDKLVHVRSAPNTTVVSTAKEAPTDRYNIVQPDVTTSQPVVSAPVSVSSLQVCTETTQNSNLIVNPTLTDDSGIASVEMANADFINKASWAGDGNTKEYPAGGDSEKSSLVDGSVNLPKADDVCTTVYLSRISCSAKHSGMSITLGNIENDGAKNSIECRTQLHEDNDVAQMLFSSKINASDATSEIQRVLTEPSIGDQDGAAYQNVIAKELKSLSEEISSLDTKIDTNTVVGADVRVSWERGIDDLKPSKVVAGKNSNSDETDTAENDHHTVDSIPDYANTSEHFSASGSHDIVTDKLNESSKSTTFRSDNANFSTQEHAEMSISQEMRDMQSSTIKAENSNITKQMANYSESGGNTTAALDGGTVRLNVRNKGADKVDESMPLLHNGDKMTSGVEDDIAVDVRAFDIAMTVPVTMNENGVINVVTKPKDFRGHLDDVITDQTVDVNVIETLRGSHFFSEVSKSASTDTVDGLPQVNDTASEGNKADIGCTTLVELIGADTKQETASVTSVVSRSSIDSYGHELYVSASDMDTGHDGTSRMNVEVGGHLTKTPNDSSLKVGRLDAMHSNDYLADDSSIYCGAHNKIAPVQKNVIQPPSVERDQLKDDNASKSDLIKVCLSKPQRELESNDLANVMSETVQNCPSNALQESESHDLSDSNSETVQSHTQSHDSHLMGQSDPIDSMKQDEMLSQPDIHACDAGNVYFTSLSVSGNSEQASHSNVLLDGETVSSSVNQANPVELKLVHHISVAGSSSENTSCSLPVLSSTTTALNISSELTTAVIRQLSNYNTFLKNLLTRKVYPADLAELISASSPDDDHQDNVISSLMANQLPINTLLCDGNGNSSAAAASTSRSQSVVSDTPRDNTSIELERPVTTRSSMFRMTEKSIQRTTSTEVDSWNLTHPDSSQVHGDEQTSDKLREKSRTLLHGQQGLQVPIVSSSVKGTTVGDGEDENIENRKLDTLNTDPAAVVQEVSTSVKVSENTVSELIQRQATKESTVDVPEKRRGRSRNALNKQATRRRAATDSNPEKPTKRTCGPGSSSNLRCGQRGSATADRQTRLVKIGDLIWGQMRGFPSWPGKVVKPSEVRGLQQRAPLSEGKVWVKWFGDHTFTQMNPTDLVTMTEGLESHHKSRKKGRTRTKKISNHLEKAIQEAVDELEQQQGASKASGISLVPNTTELTTTIDVSPEKPRRGRKRKKT